MACYWSGDLRLFFMSQFGKQYPCILNPLDSHIFIKRNGLKATLKGSNVHWGILDFNKNICHSISPSLLDGSIICDPTGLFHFFIVA